MILNIKGAIYAVKGALLYISGRIFIWTKIGFYIINGKSETLCKTKTGKRDKPECLLW